MNSVGTQRVFAVDAVAFDLDGTLLDTVQDLAAAVNLLLAEQKLSPLHVDVVRDLIGNARRSREVCRVSPTAEQPFRASAGQL